MVTETLRHLLTEAAARAVPGLDARVGRPQASTNGSEEPGINIFAYQVNPNPAWSNADLPTRNSAGTLTRRPQIGLSIDYLFSFRGPETELVPELLLGSCVSRLHAQPLLRQEQIERVIHPPEQPPHPILQDSDLANQIERVKLTQLPLSLEELSKLWSVFFQIPYMLSVAYQASVVLIEEEIEPAAPALPVRDRRIFVRPFRQIWIERVESSAGPDSPIHADSTIRILGNALGGDNVEVNIAGEALAPEQVLSREITVNLGNLTSPRAGILPLCVVHHISEDAPHLRFESNVVPLTVSPRILITPLVFTPAVANDPTTPGVDESAPPTVHLELFPAVATRQRVRLFLNELLDPDAPPSTASLSYVIESEPVEEATAELSVAARDVEARTYLARVQIDGAESPLTFDDNEESETFGRYIGPTVQVT